MQTLFRNPLASPSVLGISAGAGLGVAALLLAGGSAASVYVIRQLGLGGSWALVAAVTAGAGVVMAVVLGLSARVRDNVVMLIVGLMISSLSVAIVSLWQYFSAPEQIQEYLLWTFGSLGGIVGPQLAVLALAVGSGLLLAFASAKPPTASGCCPPMAACTPAPPKTWCSAAPSPPPSPARGWPSTPLPAPSRCTRAGGPPCGW